ncbi:FAD/NAD(P)-binding domain-containing protein [Aspergillus steynii IBT 23096]|uniref:FAD/NAD(P)-binding domain-containing protein n=1 Tax=Aspergillus steynii IBT 23096 TaxID=1392250 RepID=A0A2I2G0Z3_9EURO|nr:FAD/NAD(P)-binding domain-containing protein [Aspergillus steynii IBT 23096]PLB46547.1 FAD/NAD(P)-binding domain-containing protein [Aspergillus steynii IBT 23096]
MRYLQTGYQAALVAAISGLTAASSFQNGSYDYIVVGGGPAGIITAERFTEAGKKVLLLERGVGPTVATGANETLPWNHDLTAVDLPGMSADIGNTDAWTNYICTDTEGTAACVLGGGVTLNYMVFVHPPDHDFDDNNNWPSGWKSNDLKPASERLYQRNPGTILPSADGKRYDQGLYNVLSNFFSNLGWKAVNMITQPNEKHQAYSYPSWNIKDQKRAGPVRTYLPLAQKSENFSLRLGTKVLRVVRDGSRVTGVEVQTSSGKTEIVTLAANGRVVLAAGALSTPRVLFNSGIGPKKQIETAQKSGISVPSENQWLELPVGVGLRDHPIFSIVVQTNGSFGVPDYDRILNGTDRKDIALYRQGSGLLTQGKHRMIFFTSNEVNGKTVYYQGSCAPDANSVLGITAYMTHGATSTGVLGIDSTQKTVIEQSPYLQTDADKQAASVFVKQMIRDITAPGTGLKLTTNLNESAIIDSMTPGIHYTSTAKMGTDSGLNGGSSVVDTNTKVYGMDNLYVVDGSIHPDLPTGNIQSTIMIVAEAAAARILGQDAHASHQGKGNATACPFA